jgi:predicted ribosome quality control (RQC) complex YloA/Tae2 family protein
MNNYFTIHHQVRFLKKHLLGYRFEGAYSRYKKTVEALFSKDQIHKNLLFQAKTNAALFVQDAPVRSFSNAASFFEELEGKLLLDVQLSENDRIVTFLFEQDLRLIYYAFGPKANVFLFRGDHIIDQFRNDNRPKTIGSVQIGGLVEIATKESSREKILCREPRFPRHLIPYLLNSYSNQLTNDASLIELVDNWVKQLLHTPVFRRLDDGSICLLPETILDRATDKLFDDPNALIRDIWIQREIKDHYNDRKKGLVDQIQVASRRYEKILESLEDELVSESRIKKYETTGHILMTYSYLDLNDKDEIEVENIFQFGTTSRIPIKKGLSISENAQLYYQKAKGTRKTMIANRDRKEEIKKKMAELVTLSHSLDCVDGPKSLDRWVKDHKDRYTFLVQDQSQFVSQSQPWRSNVYQGYEILIGKSASGNDELLHYAHKEDLWFHARHVSGSHVVIRMNKKLEYPNSDVIETVAGWAAWYSKAKTASLAPVIYTKRKYVRKPKGAAPGMVIVEKENVILVSPSKPETTIEN